MINYPSMNEDLDPIEEGAIKNAIAGATIAAAALVGGHHALKQDVQSAKPTAQETASQNEKASFKKWAQTLDQRTKTLVSSILERYPHSNPKQVAKIVQAAIKYEKPSFPRAEDILSIVAIESSYRDEDQQVSNLKHDAALGFMQIRPGIWGIDPKELMQVDNNIKHGAGILKKYFDNLKNKDRAIEAYNVGITALKTGKRSNPGYVSKFKDAMSKMFSD